MEIVTLHNSLNNRPNSRWIVAMRMRKVSKTLVVFFIFANPLFRSVKFASRPNQNKPNFIERIIFVQVSKEKEKRFSTTDLLNSYCTNSLMEIMNHET